MSDATAITKAIDTLPERPTRERMVELMAQIDFIAKVIREYRPKLVALMVAEIERTGGKPIDAGGGLIWAYSESKSEKCEDVKCAAEAIYQTALAATGSESLARQRMIDSIAANGIKPGTAKRTLKEFGQEELYDVLFTTVLKKDVKGEAVKSLEIINTNFLK